MDNTGLTVSDASANGVGQGNTVLIRDTDPSYPEIPQEPRLSDLLLIAKSPIFTSFRPSWAFVLAAVSSCGNIPSLVTERG